MRLGEIKGERAVEVIADLIEPISNIASDQQNLKLFQIERREGETAHESAVRDLTEQIPILLKTHKKDVLAILSTINGVPAESMSVVDITKGALELSRDQDFLSLFISSVSTTDGNQPTPSSKDADNSKPE